MREGGDQRPHTGLAASGGDRRTGAVDPVDPHLGGRKIGRHLAASGVVRVESHRHVEAITQCGDEHACSRGAQQTRHVLDHQSVDSRCDKTIGHPEVVVQGVRRLAGIKQIARVADRTL